MLHWVIGTSLRFRLLVISVAAAVIALGVTQLRKAPVDVLPEFTPPYVEIQTEALGLSAQEVEQLITVPLEADLLNGVEGIDVLRSDSLPGLSSIVLVFEPGSDLYRSRQLVQERLTQAHALPNVSKPPTMLQPLSSSSRLLMIALDSERVSPIDRSVIARWTMRPRLMGVPGVANVAIWGFRDQQLQVQVDPARLRDRDVALNQVIATAGNAQVSSPVSFLEASTPGTGGFIETPQQRLQVRHVFDNIADAEDLGRVPVEGTGGRLRLADVATVVEDHQPLIGDAVVNDGQGLMLVVEKFPGANTVEVTEDVEAALEKLRPGLSGIRTDTAVFRPATFIEDAIDNITLALVIAAALLALALVAFLRQWRTVLIALVTIPVSLTAAALVLDALGETFNAISFAGLAVGLVLVVDDAVAGAEAVTRRMRERAVTADWQPRTAVVAEASQAVRSPLTYATLITLLVIVPVAVMEGRPGAFFEPLATAYALAVAAAMLVAVTLTPALALLVFSHSPAGVESAVVRRIRPRYATALAAFARRPRTAILAACGCVAVGLAVLPFLATSVIPSFKDRDVLVRLDGAPGTSNPRMTQIATGVGRELRAIPGVSDVGAHVGRAVTGDQHVDVNSSEVWASIDSDADYDETISAIEDVVRRVPDVQRDVVTYTTQKIRDVGALDEGRNTVRSHDLDVLTGSDKPLVVRVYGQNLEVLRREAAKVRRIIAGVDGVVDPRIELPRRQPTLEIEVDLDRAREQGIKPGDVRRAEAALLQGIQVGSVFEDQKVFDVVVQGVPETRRSVASVRNLLIDKPDGGHVRLGDVADVRIATTPTVIRREAVSRRIDVEAGVGGRGLDAVAGDVEDRLATASFPLEYHAEVLEETTTAEEIGTGRVLAFAIACAIAMFLLLQAAFRSWRLAAVAFLPFPVALTGGVIAALIDGAELSLGSLLGLLAVFGIAVRNVVVSIDHFRRLAPAGEEPFGELVRRGAQDRVSAVLTSAAALAVLALPFVVLGSRPGLEIVHPMAVVLLGGLVTSTFLTLFVVPALYMRFGRSRPPTPEEEEEELLVQGRAGAGRPPTEAAAGSAPVLRATHEQGPVS